MDYFQLGPCNENKPGQLRPLQQQQLIAQFQEVAQYQQTALTEVMTAVIQPLITQVTNQDKALSSIMQVILNMLNNRISTQTYDLGQFINDFRSIITSEIAEQRVLVNLLTSLLDTDQQILETLLQGSPTLPTPPLPPLPAPTPAPGTPPGSVIPPLPPGSEPPTPAAPTPPSTPLPIVIKVPVYLPCPSAGPTNIAIDVSDVVSPIFNNDNTVAINIGLGGGGLPGGSGAPLPVKPEPPAEGPGGGGSEGVAIPYPVDLDQPLAFIFSPDDAKWKQKAIAFYGESLILMTSDTTLKQIQAQITDYNEQLFPNNWGGVQPNA